MASEGSRFGNSGFGGASSSGGRAHLGGGDKIDRDRLGGDRAERMHLGEDQDHRQN